MLLEQITSDSLSVYSTSQVAVLLQSGGPRCRQVVESLYAKRELRVYRRTSCRERSTVFDVQEESRASKEEGWQAADMAAQQAFEGV